MKNELITKLEELKQLAEEAFVASIQKPRMSNHYYISEIMKLDVTSTEKLILIDMLLHSDGTKEQYVLGTAAQERLRMDKGMYNGGIRKSIQRGYVRSIAKGKYIINTVF